MIKNNKFNQIEELSERINNAKNKTSENESASKDKNNANLAWRMVTELVSGMLIGFVIGYGLDYFFNTAPFLMIIISLLGFGAGVKTMMKTASEIKTDSQ